MSPETTSKSPPDPIAPPDPALLAEIDAVGHRLRACLAEILRKATDHAGAQQNDPKTSKNLAKTLRVDPVLAKKLVRLTDPQRTAADIVAQAPKPHQLLKLHQHLNNRADALNLGELELWPLRDAISKLDTLITAAGGSKMQLTRAIRAHQPTTPHATAADTAHNGELLILGDDNAVRTETGERWGGLCDANPLTTPARIEEAIDEAGAHTTLVIDSGRFQPHNNDPADNDDTDIEAAHRTWSNEGIATLARTLRPLLDRASSNNVRIALRPRVGDVLADPQRAHTFLRSAAPDTPHAGLAVALDPAALLTPTHRTRAHDHITRALEALSSRTAAVLLTTNQPPDDPPIDLARTAALARRLAPTAPIIVRTNDAATARRALGHG